MKVSDKRIERKAEKSKEKLMKMVHKEINRFEKEEKKYGNPTLYALAKADYNIRGDYNDYISTSKTMHRTRSLALFIQAIGCIMLFVWAFTDVTSVAIASLMFQIIAVESLSESRSLYLKMRLDGERMIKNASLKAKEKVCKSIKENKKK